MENERITRKSLDVFQMRIEKKFNEIIQSDADFSLVKLRDEFNEKTVAGEITALRILEIDISHYSRKVDNYEISYAALRKYERSKELLLNFIRDKYQKDVVSYKSITTVL